MPNPGMRSRIVRLLRGDFYTSDLKDLFLYSRDRCHGRESVKEVGDFIAHQNERIKGITTDVTREWCITAWVQFLSWQNRLNFAGLPTTFPEFLDISFRRADPRNIKAATGVKRKKDAKPLLSALAGRIVNNADGTLALLQVTVGEFRLLQCLTNHLD
jgi:hypothetical protein